MNYEILKKSEDCQNVALCLLKTYSGPHNAVYTRRRDVCKREAYSGHAMDNFTPSILKESLIALICGASILTVIQDTVHPLLADCISFSKDRRGRFSHYYNLTAFTEYKSYCT